MDKHQHFFFKYSSSSQGHETSAKNQGFFLYERIVYPVMSTNYVAYNWFSFFVLESGENWALHGSRIENLEDEKNAPSFAGSI
jgi:hypothetical protein